MRSCILILVVGSGPTDGDEFSICVIVYHGINVYLEAGEERRVENIFLLFVFFFFLVFILLSLTCIGIFFLLDYTLNDFGAY